MIQWIRLYRRMSEESISDSQQHLLDFGSEYVTLMSDNTRIEKVQDDMAIASSGIIEVIVHNIDNEKINCNNRMFREYFQPKLFDLNFLRHCLILG